MLKAASAALHLLNIRKEFFCFHELKYSFCHPFVSQHHEWHKRQRSRQRLDSDLFCRVSHLTSDLDLWCVYFVMELNTHRGKLKKKGTRWWSSPCSLLYTDLSTWNNDGIRKCSFMVPEYNFCFLSFCVRGCFSCFWLQGRRFVYINENVS